VFNGFQLRIVDANRLYARRHLEIDLDLALDNPGAFAVLLHLFGASALGSEPGDPRSLHALVSESDRHAAGVCRSLREGVLGASVEILRALVAGRVRRTAHATAQPGGDGRANTSVVVADSFEQALTIVYRMLFLLFAEARALVPLWHPIYRESYSLEGLRDAAEQLPPAPGLWDALRAIARLAHTGCRAGDLQVTPFNGRLFSPTHTPLAERRDLDDSAARRAVVALSTRPRPIARQRAHRVSRSRRRAARRRLRNAAGLRAAGGRGSVSLHTGSGVRKATGTFYTPQPIADYLVRRTLGPLVHDAAPDRILQLRIVDPAMGSGAFLVAACRFLAGAYESALVRDGRCHSSDIGESERVSIRRTIAERCLYGVDLNPMAVQLARLSLWLATLAADRPLSFLDHRLQVGDSLLGTWLAHVRQPPSLRRRRSSSDSLPLFDGDAITSAVQAALPLRFSLESPNDTVEQVRAKERAFAELTGRHASLSRWKRIAHLWCAPWFAPAGTAAPESAFGALTDAVLTGRSALPPRTADRYLEQAEALAQARRFFHWELEFPEVFFDLNGAPRRDAGFDAVIGNPPWDMIRADQGAADTRSRARTHGMPVVRFTRDAGVYTAQSDGHANRYQLFVERAIGLTRPGGRMGLVLPSGFATDRGSAALRRLLFSRCSVERWSAWTTVAAFSRSTAVSGSS
jgi:Type I restriction-modification system methyltransferase subunit